MTLPYLDKNTLYEEIVHDKKRNRALAKAGFALQLKAIYDGSNLISEQRSTTICILSSKYRLHHEKGNIREEHHADGRI